MNERPRARWRGLMVADWQDGQESNPPTVAHLEGFSSLMSKRPREGPVDLDSAPNKRLRPHPEQVRTASFLPPPHTRP